MLCFNRRSLILAVLTLTALLLVGCGLAPLGPARAAEAVGGTGTDGSTRVITFAPTGTPTEQVDGYCWVRSLAVWRDGAWRCMSGNRIYDPCFSASDTSPDVVCVPNPLDQAKNVKLVLNRPLPAGTPGPTRTRAWALALDDGAVCTYITGATGPVDGQRLSYGCTNGWDVVGEPVPDGTWTAREVLLKPRSLVVLQSREAMVRTVWE